MARVSWHVDFCILQPMHPDDASDARLKQHYALVIVFEIAVVAALWAWGRAFS